MQKLSSPIKLIKESFETFTEKKNLQIFVLTFILLVPFQIALYFLDGVKNNSTIWIIVVLNLFYVICYLLTQLAGIFVVKKVVDKDTDISFKNVLLFVKKNLWKFFLLEVLVFLAVLGGFILLIIPGIVLSVWFSFSCFIFVDQRLGIKASMGKSRNLVKGRFWAVFGRVVVFGLFSGLVGAVLSFIPYGIGSYLVTLAEGLFILPSFLLYRELASNS
jgi:hypothetical protein